MVSLRVGVFVWAVCTITLLLILIGGLYMAPAIMQRGIPTTSSDATDQWNSVIDAGSSTRRRSEPGSASVRTKITSGTPLEATLPDGTTVLLTSTTDGYLNTRQQSHATDSTLMYGSDGTTNRPIKTDLNGAQAISVLSTTSNELIANASTFTGPWTICYDYSSISILVKTISGDSSGGTLYADFSIDGVTAHHTIQLSDGTGHNYGVHTLIPVAQYFRVRLDNNDADEEFSIDVQLIFNKHARLPTSALDEPLNSKSSVFNTRAVIAGVDESGKLRTGTVDIEGNLHTSIVSPTTAFGELRVEQAVPVIQVHFIYGINLREIASSVSDGGSFTSSDAFGILSTSTDPAGRAEFRSQRFVRYRPGQGIQSRFTTVHPSCAPNMTSLVGIGDDANGFFLGCLTGTFGICHRTGGIHEQYKMALSGTVVDKGSIDIILADDDAVSIDLTDGDSASLVASKVADGTYPGWTVYATDADVFFERTVTGDQSGTFDATFITSTGITDTWTEEAQGVDPTDTIIPQSTWNVDVLNGTGPSGMTLDETKGNVYQIQYKWLGFGSITFSAETRFGKFQIIHRITYSNMYTKTSIQQPTQTLYALVENNGATDNNQVKIPSMAAFVEGLIAITSLPHSATNTYSTPNEVGSPNEVISFQSNRLYGGVTSKIVSSITQIRASYVANTNQECTLYTRRNPTVTGNSIFTADTTTPVSVSKQTTAEHSGGTLLHTMFVPGGHGDSATFTFGELHMVPGDIISLSVECTASAAVTVSVMWNDDL